MSSVEISTLENKFAQYFTDILLETIKSFSMPKQYISERFSLKNSDVIKQLDPDRPLMIMSQHMGNWEWANVALENFSTTDFHVLIKPLSNPYLNSYLSRQRSKRNIFLISSAKAIFNTIQTNRSRPNVFCFLVDQYPAGIKHKIESSFFNHNVEFNASAFYIAQRINAQIVYADIIQTKRGYYEIDFKVFDKNNTNDINILIDFYVQELEKTIRRHPEQWLWSHKRFKDQLDY